jgi:hypothetical protein
MEIVPFREEHFARYQAFSRRSYGDDAYQATRNYVDWLYRENPSPNKSDSDFLLAITPDQQVVGCVHKMRLPWRVGERDVEIPALHNIVVGEQHRTGTGFMLILKIHANHEHALIPGVQAPLNEVFIKLKYQPVSANWYRKLVRPVAAAVRLARGRMGMPSRETRYFDEATIAATHLPNGIRATRSPDAALLTQLASSVNQRSAGAQARPHWDAKWLAWRFFHPRGPRHCLVYRDSDFLIFSLGPRHGMNAARLIEASAASAQSLKALLSAGEPVLKRSGAHVLMTVCADAQLNDMLSKLGWTAQRDHIDTYFYHRTRTDQFTTYQFHGSAGDFGFEAIPPDVTK